jgi:purine-binding chemotaxis protein CheW
MPAILETPSVSSPTTSPAPAAPASAAAASATKSAVAAKSGRQTDGELLQLVSFVVGNEEFAVPILTVQEINRMMQITRVPQSPMFVEGVINLRGRIIPVIDLRRRFGLETQDHNSDSRIIVVEVEERTLGFVVDKVQEVLRIEQRVVEAAPDMVTSLQSEYIDGIAKLEDRLLILLNLNRLFSGTQLAEIDQKILNKH